MASERPLLDGNNTTNGAGNHLVLNMDAIGDKYDDQRPNQSSHELAFIRTYFACQRTYMASIRTNAIFVGLSLVLVNNDHEIAAMAILFFCVGANILETYNFYHSFSHFTNIKKRVLQILPSILYSLLLNVVLLYVFFVDSQKVDDI